jgi:ribulose-5-phosphate 4-epimerase/fuculose-1-phosphate aldolase
MKQHISDTEWHTRMELTAAYHLAARFGWTDLIYTHISARVPGEQNTYLINPFGLHFHEVTPENLIKVNFDGEIVEESKFSINPAGAVIHSAIHKARRDVGCVIHLHTISGVAVSSVKDGLLPISQHALHLFGDIAYHDYEGIAMRDEEKHSIVEDLGDKNILLLRNHGFLAAASSIAETFMLMYMLEKAAEIQVKTLSQGLPICPIPTEICVRAKEQVNSKRCQYLQLEWQALLRLLDNPNLSSLLEKIAA